jgi:hypothetical protein
VANVVSDFAKIDGPQAAHDGMRDSLSALSRMQKQQ